MTNNKVTKMHVISDDDLYLFNEGTHIRLSDRMGARLVDLPPYP